MCLGAQVAQRGRRGGTKSKNDRDRSSLILLGQLQNVTTWCVFCWSIQKLIPSNYEGLLCYELEICLHWSVIFWHNRNRESTLLHSYNCKWSHDKRPISQLWTLCVYYYFVMLLRTNRASIIYQGIAINCTKLGEWSNHEHSYQPKQKRSQHWDPTSSSETGNETADLQRVLD